MAFMLVIKGGDDDSKNTYWHSKNTYRHSQNTYWDSQNTSCSPYPWCAIPFLNGRNLNFAPLLFRFVLLRCALFRFVPLCFAFVLLKRNEAKRNRMKRNETKQNEAKRNQTKNPPPSARPGGGLVFGSKAATLKIAQGGLVCGQKACLLHFRAKLSTFFGRGGG